MKRRTAELPEVRFAVRYPVHGGSPIRFDQFFLRMMIVDRPGDKRHGQLEPRFTGYKTRAMVMDIAMALFIATVFPVYKCAYGTFGPAEVVEVRDKTTRARTIVGVVDPVTIATGV